MQQSFQNQLPPLKVSMDSTKQNIQYPLIIKHNVVDNQIQENQYNDVQKMNKQYNKSIAFEKFSKPQLLFSENQDIQISLCENNIKSFNTVKQIKQVQFNIISPLRKGKSIKYYKEKFIKNLEVNSDDEFDDYPSGQEIIVKVRTNENIKSILKLSNKKNEKTQHKIEIIKVDQLQQSRKYDVQEQKLFQHKVAQYRYGVGLTFLQKFGFEFSSGLGKGQQGILEPLQIKLQDQFVDCQKTQPPISDDANSRKKVKIDISDEENINNEKLSLSDSKTVKIENGEDKEQIQKQQFLKYLLYLNQEEVIFTQNGFEIADLQKYQECFIKFKHHFIEYNLLGLLINKYEQKIKLLAKNWVGPRTQLDLLTKEFSMISKIINFAKFVIQENKQTKSLTQQELIILQNYINTLVNPIIQQLKAYILEKYHPTTNALPHFFEFWSKSTICIVLVENQTFPIELNLKNAIEEIKNKINQKEQISRPMKRILIEI